MFTLNKQPNFKLKQNLSNRKIVICSQNSSANKTPEFKKYIEERRAIFESARKKDLKTLHDQLVIISKEELKFSKTIINEAFPPEGIEKLKNLFMPPKDNYVKTEIVSDDDYFKDETI